MEREGEDEDEEEEIKSTTMQDTSPAGGSVACAAKSCTTILVTVTMQWVRQGVRVERRGDLVDHVQTPGPIRLHHGQPRLRQRLSQEASTI